MRVLMLTRYGRLGASSRMRSYQYLPWLEKDGIEVIVSPLLSDAYVENLQQGRRSPPEVLAGYFQRLKVLLGTKPVDVIWIEKEALPWVPIWIEQRLLPKDIPYILDYDDAVFHYYNEHRNPGVKALLGDKHTALMRGAELVVAGNEYLADVARRSGARQIEIVPTVIDMERYPVHSGSLFTRQAMPPRVGWIGQRATASFLMPYKGLFERFASRDQAQFVAIGINAASLGLPMESIVWTEQTEAASIASLDIGIMPLVDEPFERGKCGYKLIQYMASGLPVIASPVGVNRQIVEHGINGFLAETPQQWEEALHALLADPGLRHRMGMAGREKVAKLFCIQLTGPKRAALVRRVVASWNSCK